MTWFKVDDSFHSHLKVLAAEPAALGLWVVAGSWCGANLTDGFVPDHVLSRLIPGSTPLALQLVDCGLWRRAKGGYRFHDWAQYQPTRDEATAAKTRKSSGGRLGNHRRWHVNKSVTDPNCVYCSGRSGLGTDIGTEGDPMGGPIDNRSDKSGHGDGSMQDSNQANGQVDSTGLSVIRSDSDRSTESRPSPPDPTRPDPSSYGSVGESSSVRTTATRSDDDSDLTNQIIKLLAELTGRGVTAEHATRVRGQLLTNRDIANPARYVDKAIRANPRQFLPATAVDPSSRSLNEALAHARGEIA